MINRRKIKISNKVQFGLTDSLLTAVGADFENNHSVLPMTHLTQDVKGSNVFNDAVLKALVPFVDDLMKGLQVDVVIEEARDGKYVSYSVIEVNVEKTWELIEKVSHEELEGMLQRITGIFGSVYYVHKGGDIYYGTTACTINMNGRSFLGMTYVPVSEAGKILTNITHTRPLNEFATNRFIMVESMYESFYKLLETIKAMPTFTFYALKLSGNEWNYSFLPFKKESFDEDLKVEIYKVRVEQYTITESTLDPNVVGMLFNDVYGKRKN